MADPPVLEAVDLTRLYPDGTGVRGARLRVYAGEIAALVGPNGAGKTTLLEALAGRPPQPGRVRLLGTGHDRRRAFLKRLAYLPEARALPPFLAGRTAARLAEELWQQPGLYLRFLQEAARLGLAEADLDRPARVLSQGTREKLALALVFSREARLYLLDEPEAHLDPIVRNVLENRLAELRAAGKAVLFATHDVYLAARLADRILLVKDGRVRPSETKDPEAILAALTGGEEDERDPGPSA